MGHGTWTILRGRVKWPGKRAERAGKELAEATLVQDLKGGEATVKITGWQEHADAVAALKRDDEVEVSGWLSLNHWTNKDGKEVWQNQVNVVEVVALGAEPTLAPTDDDSIPF